MKACRWPAPASRRIVGLARGLQDLAGFPRPVQQLFSKQPGSIEFSNLFHQIALHGVANSQGVGATEALVRELAVDYLRVVILGDGLAVDARLAGSRGR